MSRPRVRRINLGVILLPPVPAVESAEAQAQRRSADRAWIEKMLALAGQAAPLIGLCRPGAPPVTYLAARGHPL